MYGNLCHKLHFKCQKKKIYTGQEKNLNIVSLYFSNYFKTKINYI